MRLFAALLPPERALAELGSVVDELRRLPGADTLRWTGRPGWPHGGAVSWHCTLAFYGEVDEDAVPGLSAALERTARRTEPFGLAVRGGGQFGDGRALWAGVEGDVAALRRLAERCEEAAPTGDFAGRAWTVDELVLVRSNLPRSGVPGEQPRYEAVARWGLGAGG